MSVGNLQSPAGPPSSAEEDTPEHRADRRDSPGSRNRASYGAGKELGIVEILLKVVDVARVLNTTPRNVYYLAEHRDPAVRLPSVKLGRRSLRFRAADVERYLGERAS